MTSACDSRCFTFFLLSAVAPATPGGNVGRWQTNYQAITPYGVANSQNTKSQITCLRKEQWTTMSETVAKMDKRTGRIAEKERGLKTPRNKKSAHSRKRASKGSHERSDRVDLSLMGRRRKKNIRVESCTGETGWCGWYDKKKDMTKMHYKKLLRMGGAGHLHESKPCPCWRHQKRHKRHTKNGCSPPNLSRCRCWWQGQWGTGPALSS